MEERVGRFSGLEITGDVARDGNEWAVVLLPGEARELGFVEDDVPRDDDPTGLGVPALVALVPLFEPEIDAALGVPLGIDALLLLHMHIGAAAEDSEHGEVGLLAIEGFVGRLVLQRGGGGRVHDADD